MEKENGLRCLNIRFVTAHWKIYEQWKLRIDFTFINTDSVHGIAIQKDCMILSILNLSFSVLFLAFSQKKNFILIIYYFFLSTYNLTYIELL